MRKVGGYGWFSLTALAILLWALLPATFLGQEQAAEGAGGSEDEGFVGSDFCAECHDEVAEAFKSTVHWTKTPERACESCHGPGAGHVEEADPEKIRRFISETDPHERSAACLDCHGRNRTHRGFTRGGLPIGLQLIARPFEEARLLRLALAYEQATDWSSHHPDLRGFA